MTGESTTRAWPGLGVPVEAGADVGRVSREAASTAARQGFSPAGTERAERMAADLAARLVTCQGSGRMLVRPLDADGRLGVELLLSTAAIGPSLQPHPGPRAGGSAPVADRWEVYAAPGRGTVAMAQLWDTSASAPSGRRFVVGSLAEPIPGEVVSGDAWAVEQHGGRLVVLVADGLGHGEHAAAASGAAVAAFEAHHTEPVEQIVARLHDVLRPTRGAAVGVAEIDQDAGHVRFCGIGNVTARLLSDDGAHELLSRYGIAGYQTPSVRAVTRAWPDDAMLVMHSDGLSSRWDAAAYPDLRLQHPLLVAATVLRDAVRAHDDVLVAAVRGVTGAGPGRTETPDA